MKKATDRSAAAKKAAIARKRRAAGRKAALTKKRRAAAIKGAATRKANDIIAKKRSEAAIKAAATRKATKHLQQFTAFEQPAASDMDDPFAKVELVSVDYDDQGPERYDQGTFIGMVVKRLDNQMKVIFAYEAGEESMSLLEWHKLDRWIDKTWRTVVTVEEATTSQREAFRRYISPKRLALLLKNEGSTVSG